MSKPSVVTPVSGVAAHSGNSLYAQFSNGTAGIGVIRQDEFRTRLALAAKRARVCVGDVVRVDFHVTLCQFFSGGRTLEL